MQLHQLEYFLAVAEGMSFTGGARSLHVVQSAVSSGVRQLERELGTDLFVRLGRRIRLTPAGEALVPHARAVLAGVAAAKDAVDGVRGVVRGTVVLGTLTHVGPIDTADVLGDLHAEDPGVVVKLRQTTQGTRSSLEDVRAGVLDLAIVASPTARVPGVILQPLHTEPLVFICSERHRLAGSTAVSPADLAGESFIDFPEGWGNRMAVDAAFEAAGAERTVQAEVVGFQTAVELVQRNFGVAFVAASVLDRHPASGLWTVPTALEWRLQLARSAAREPTAAELAVMRAYDRAYHRAAQGPRGASRTER
ncbi:LysR family transcriptional regulator [Sinomonas susongensis]|uniref:LysR family transcriptional regulator n=1 Tax=Sinomonas susongensis TaxID=1324851 RepID=UPI00110931E1|nr:LysR family transcriptional regulator [Sinomonas susongensis]